MTTTLATQPLAAIEQLTGRATNPAWNYILSLAPGTSQATMEGALARSAALIWGDAATIETAPWATIRAAHITALRNHLDGFAPSTVNVYFSAIRGTLKEAWRAGALDTDEYHRVIDFKAATGSRLPAGRALELDEIGKLFAACTADRSAKPVLAARDLAIIALAYNTGARRQEICSLELADYDRDTRTLVIRHGKGNKEREVFLNTCAADALDTWLRFRGAQPGAIFCRVHKNGRIEIGELSCAAMWQMIAARAQQAGLKKVTPHDLRRAVATSMLASGVGINTVKDLLGHASVTTTARYDRSGAKAVRSAAEAMEMPQVEAKS